MPVHMQPDKSPLRIARAGVEARRPSIEILVNGRSTAALEGETVAAALTAAGHRVLRITSQGAPSGLYCGMGVCFECRDTINGRPGERSCLALVQPGMQILTERHANETKEAGGESRVSANIRENRAQLLVLGAGPAGLAAADAAAARGIQVVILDERPAPGGQFFKPLAGSHRVTGGRHLDRQFGNGAALVDRVRTRGVRILSGTTVWDAQARPEGGVTVRALDDDGPHTWTADKLVVATGAYERPWPVPGWTLPGAMTTGAAQTLTRSYQVAPGRRVLFAGNGPLNFQVAADLASNGIHVVAVAEAAQSPFRARSLDLIGDLIRVARTRPDLLRDGLLHMVALRRNAVPLLHNHVLVRIEGDDCVERAVVSGIDPNGVLIGGSEKVFDVDAVCAGYGFAPSNEITRLIGCRHGIDGRNGTSLIATRDEDGRTSIRDVFIAGDAGGPWGAHTALHQGRIAGLAVACDLAGQSKHDLERIPGQIRDLRSRLAREVVFQESLWRIFSAPDFADRLATDDTIICRCENVRFGDVRREIERGSTDIASIKRATRCGMGPCQGRYCSVSIAQMLASRAGVKVGEQTFFRTQTPIRPVPIDSIARAHPDITAFASLNELPVEEPGASGERIADVGTLIIGGGIVGLCTAHELARGGDNVVVVERNEPHAEASGVNAGSLHVQFQTFGFPDLGSEAVYAPVSTLALQRDSVYLWDGLAKQTGADFEIAIEGGLTVADDDASLAHLRQKVELERKAGLNIELISGDEARVLAPYLSKQIVAASLSRDEGKINPLKASPAVLAAAIAAGARLYARTRVLAIERIGRSGFIVSTDRGSFAARRVVNAAGAWAGSIGALAGDPIPVRPNPIQMLVTEAIPPTIPYHLAHATRRLTLKQAASGNLIIGGGWRAIFDPCSQRMRPSAEAFSGNLAVVLRMLPAFGSLLVIRSWTGIAFVAPPVIGESAKVPGLYHVVTQNGMTLGPVVGRTCADLILGRRQNYDLRPFSPSRFG